MIKVLLKNSTEPLQLSISELEQAMGMRWLDSLEFQKDRFIKKVVKHSQIAMKKRELSIQEKWIGVYFHKEISKGFIPPITIQWIDERLGYGVFAERDIPAGAFIGEYTGKIRKRKRWADRKNDYCFEYTIGDWIRNPFIIDAKDQGNFTRFINHSNEPNLEPMSVYADGIMHIVFVVKKPIQKGMQLSYDYGETFWKKRKNSKLLL